MSFLLRNRSNTNGGSGRIFPRPAAASLSAVASRSRTTACSRGQQRPSAAGIQTGNQVLLQRPQKQSQRCQNSIHEQHSKPKSEGDAVISMSEVLADLRILEQQQRDAHRKLASVRAMKQQRSQQHIALTANLETLKYSNGELRAQINQYHDLLANANRSLNARKLATDSAGGDIRDFEHKLKRGLKAESCNAATLRKIESIFILAQTKLDSLRQMNLAAKTKQAELETALDIVRRKEAGLRTAIQERVAEVQKGALDMASIRTQGIEAEKELLAAQNLEESIRSRMVLTATEVEGQVQDHREEISALSQHNQVLVQTASELTQEKDALAKEVASVLKQLQEIESSRETSMVVDCSKLESEVSTCEEHLATLEDRNNTFHDDVESKKQKLSKVSQGIAENRERTDCLEKDATDILASEKSRAESISSFEADLNQERQSAMKLKVSLKGLKEARDVAASKQIELATDCDREAELARQQIQAVRISFDQENAVYDKLLSSWLIEKSTIQASVEETQSSLRATQNSLNQDELDSKNSEGDFESKLNHEITTIEAQTQGIRAQKQAKVTFSSRKHPILEPVVENYFRDDEIMSKDGIHKALQALKEKLREMIREKKEDYNRKKQKREIVEKSMKRKEEELRKSEERIKNELKRQETKELLEGDLSNKGRQSTSNRAGKARKGADFFLPQTQENLSEEETPAHPKSLLSSFARAMPVRASFEPTQSQDKRVHWKDDDASDCDSEANEKISIEAISVKSSRKSKSYSKPREVAKTKHLVKDKSNRRPNLNVDPLNLTAMTLDFGSDSHPISGIDSAKTKKAKQGATSSHPSTKNGDTTTTSSTKVVSGIANSSNQLPLERTGRGGRQTYSFKDDKSTVRKDLKDKRGPQDISRKGREAVAGETQKNKEANHETHKLATSSSSRVKDKSAISVSKKPDFRSSSDSTRSARSVTSNTSRSSKRSKGAIAESLQPRPFSHSGMSIASHSHGRSERSAKGPIKSSSRSEVSESSQGMSRDSLGSKRRKLNPKAEPSTQPSGLSSCEGVTKIRRRKKNTGLQNAATNMLDDTYAFGF